MNPTQQMQMMALQQFAPAAVPATFAPRVPLATAAEAQRDGWMHDVCDLIAAAGPLSVRDIAGGLNASVRDAYRRVRAMVAMDVLQQDEFERFRLRGDCPDGR